MICVDFIIYSGGRFGLDLDMVSLAEYAKWAEYQKSAYFVLGTDSSKLKTHIPK